MPFNKGGNLNQPAPLSNLVSDAGTPAVSSPTLTLPVSIGLSASGPLPPIDYQTQFTVDTQDGSIQKQDESQDQISINGENINSSNGAAAFTAAVLKQVAGPIFDRFAGIIPPSVTSLLLGNTVLFGGLTVTDLLGGTDPLTLIGDVAGDIVGPEAAVALQVVDQILHAEDFATELDQYR